MAKKSAINSDPDTPPKLFSTGREKFWLAFFILFLALDISELGLVSEQIHKHGGQNIFDWPGQEYGHVMGLMLFDTIFALLFGIFHWAAGLGVYLVVFFMNAVFAGTVAGVLENTPFGHGLQCKNPSSAFPAAYQPYLSDCTRVLAIEGIAWALFGLSVIGFFYTIFDQFSFSRKRTIVYTSIAERGEIKQRKLDEAEKARKEKANAEAAHI